MTHFSIKTFIFLSQVERKRHIGNDIVNIIFMDGPVEETSHFQPKYIKSHFTHIYAVVCYQVLWSNYTLKYQLSPYSSDVRFDTIYIFESKSSFFNQEDSDSYHLSVLSDDSVPLFGPLLTNLTKFTDHDDFIRFLLIKLINGEKAT